MFSQILPVVAFLFKKNFKRRGHLEKHDNLLICAEVLNFKYFLEFFLFVLTRLVSLVEVATSLTWV